MNASEYLMTCGSEECMELTAELIASCSKVGIRLSKAVRFGCDEVQPGQTMPNAERVRAELHDLLGVVELMVGAGLIESPDDRAAIEAKKEKVRTFMGYSRSLGAVSDAPQQTETAA